MSTHPTSDAAPLKATCHCGRVQVEIPRKPEKLNQCRCTVCYKYGCLWGYFKTFEVKVTMAEGTHLDEYVRSDEGSQGCVSFDRCSHCGCLVTWSGKGDWEGPDKRKGVNCRMLPLDVVDTITKETTFC